MLAFTTLEDETSQTASTHRKAIDTVSEQFKKSAQNVVAIVGDNSATNNALANNLGVGYFGCASHRYNLTVKDMLQPHMEIIMRVHPIM